MNKFSLALSFALLFPISGAFAQTPARTVDQGAQEGVEIAVQFNGQDTGVGIAASSSVLIREDSKAHATGTTERNNEVSTTTGNNNGEGMGATHRSVVATFVHSLLTDADRDGRIGTEVRAVARSQSDSASTTVDAIAKVENRSAFKTFFLGSDWENIGALRSQIVKNDADIARLETAMSSSTDITVRTDLQVQINSMKAEQTKIQSFVDSHANGFSLFGWFTRLFVSADAGKS